jgi:hypothetical protein
MTIFHKITHSAKLVILLIIPTYAKVSKRMSICNISMAHFSVYCFHFQTVTICHGFISLRQ